MAFKLVFILVIVFSLSLSADDKKVDNSWYSKVKEDNQRCYSHFVAGRSNLQMSLEIFWDDKNKDILDYDFNMTIWGKGSHKSKGTVKLSSEKDTLIYSPYNKKNVSFMFYKTDLEKCNTTFLISKETNESAFHLHKKNVIIIKDCDIKIKDETIKDIPMLIEKSYSVNKDSNICN